MKNHYSITRDALEKVQYPTPEGLKNEMTQLFYDSRKGKNKTKDRLIKLINKYPNSPQLRNYLSVWYLVNGNTEMAGQTIDELYELFPDYTFAKISKAKGLIEQDKLDEAENIIGKDLSIQNLDPEREIFHISEYHGYVDLAITYLLKKGKTKEAQEYLQEAAEIMDESLFTTLEKMISIQLLQEGFEKMLKRSKNSSNKDAERLPSLPQLNEMLKPSSEKYAYLFNDYWDFDFTILKKQIEENPDELIEELKRIIRNSIACFEYCEANDEWSMAPIYALYILPFVADSKIATDTLFEFINQPEKVLDFWMVDWLSDIVEAYYVNTHVERLNEIEKFLKTPSVGYYPKSLLLDYLAKKINYYPEKRGAIIALLHEIFDYFEKHQADENLFDEIVLSAVVSCAIDIEARELLPVIEHFYSKDWIDVEREGNFEDVKERLLSGVHSVDEVAPISLFDEIGNFRTIGAENKKRNEEEAKKAQLNSIPANTPRNAPCPCSSGKKYKHCHGKS